jgi:hypothetical protein
MTANTFRSEITITVGGTKYTVRPTIELLAKFEDAYGNLLYCLNGKKIHEIYGMIGMLLENAVNPVAAGTGAQLAFDEGIKDMDPVLNDFIKCALRVPQAAATKDEKKQSAGAEKKAGKKSA